MIVAWIFVTSLCCAFSLPVTRSTSNVRIFSKRNVNVDPGSSISEDPVLVDTDDKFEGFSWKDIFSPQRLWSLHCEPNCDASEIFSDSSVEGKDGMAGSDDVGGDVTSDFGTPADEDMVLHLNADKDLMKFLQWTTSHLASLHNASGKHDRPGPRTWIKLNLSGRRERPLYAEEPKYIVFRRDLGEFVDIAPHLDTASDMPFIPPRGRKFIPNLDALLTHNDIFVPNRGKKKSKNDPLEDLLKYDDLFFPHRGKKDILKDTFKYDDIFFPHRGKKDILKDIFKYDDIFFPHRGKKFDDSTGELKPVSSYTQLSGIPPFADCFSRCGDIPSAPVAVFTDPAGNINELVSAMTLHPPWVSSSALDAVTSGSGSGGHRGAASAACAGGAAYVAECQKQNDVKINGFDQSVNAQIHQLQHQQQPPSTGVAIADPHQQQEEQIQQRRLSSARPSASEGTSASSLLPFIWSDQVRRVLQQPHPIRSGQWRDYYI